jgi:hypothetical protein
LILVPWEVGQVSCENLNLTLGQASCEKKNRTDFPVDLPVLEGCNRPSNRSACDDNCMTKTDECFLDYGFSVVCTIANHSSEPLLLIQVFRYFFIFCVFAQILFSSSGYSARNGVVGINRSFLRILPAGISSLGRR